MKISIAMATYNGDQFILEQLESFSNQSVFPDELVITDDNSSDHTLEIIEEFKKNAPFKIRVFINKENLGYTQNFNRALQLCENELIFLSDQDDVWFPNKLEYMVGLANKYNDKDVFLIDAELTDENLNRTYLTKLNQIKNAGLGENNFVMGCCIATRKTYLDKIMPIPENFHGHDSWIAMLADKLDLKVIDTKVLQFYRRHEDNTSPIIVNSLTKINQLTLLKNRIYSVFKSSRSISIKNDIAQTKELLKGMEKLLQYDEYKNKLQDEINLLTNRLFLMQKRLNIVEETNMFSRIGLGLKFYFQGNYKIFSDHKSLFRDILN